MGWGAEPTGGSVSPAPNPDSLGGEGPRRAGAKVRAKQGVAWGLPRSRPSQPEAPGWPHTQLCPQSTPCALRPGSSWTPRCSLLLRAR